jgi:hypothetical protein
MEKRRKEERKEIDVFYNSVFIVEKLRISFAKRFFPCLVLTYI